MNTHWKQPAGGFDHSYRSASMGLSAAALRAGYHPKKIPMAAEKPKPNLHLPKILMRQLADLEVDEHVAAQ